MKALILNGAYEGDDSPNKVRDVLSEEIVRIGGTVETVSLRDMKIAYCQGEFGCWVRTPGVCIIHDAAHEIAKAYIRSDLVVFLSPVTFGGYSSELKKALDRIICLISPFFVKIRGEVHHKKRYERYPKLIGIGILPDADEESGRIFETLVNRNAINLHAPAVAAGVIPGKADTDDIREKVRNLFSVAEVTK